MLATNTGFEDIIFQFEVCPCKSLNGVLADTHYNKIWTVHIGMQSNLAHFIFGLSTQVKYILLFPICISFSMIFKANVLVYVGRIS